MPSRLAQLRDRFENAFRSRFRACERNGSAHDRVPNTSNLSFESAPGEALIIALDLQGVMCLFPARLVLPARSNPPTCSPQIGLSPDQAPLQPCW